MLDRIGKIVSDRHSVRATKAEKERRDFERQVDIIDNIDTYYGDYRDYDRIKKIDVNLDLLNGRLDLSLYEDPLCFDVPNSENPNLYEEVSFDYQNLTHTPLIAQYANAFIGEMIGYPFKPMIVDNSPNKANILKMRAMSLNKQYILSNIVNPARTKIMNSILEASGVEDAFTLASSPEAQMELEQEINKRLSEELPNEIKEFLNGNVKTTTAKEAQAIVNYLVDKLDIRFEQINGFKYAVATGEEYYYVGPYNGQLQFECVHPKYLSWGGGDRENEWVQHADWVKRERWLSYQQLISRHADKLSSRDIDMLDIDVEPMGGFSRGTPFWDRDNAHTKQMLYTYSQDEGLREAFSDVNIKTIEGRKRLFQLYNVAFNRYGQTYGNNISDYGIREAYIEFRDLRKMIVVKRQDERTGKYREFYLPEHYEPTHNDYDVREAWINQVWQGYKLGTFDSLYVGIKPKPYQYKSIFNPYDVDLSFYGKKYNTHNNSTKNISLVDLGKSGQKNFDLTLASIRQDMATNHGKVFTMFMDMKPEGWTYQQWLDMSRNAGVMMLDPNKNNTQLDFQFMKHVDLSKMSDIASKINLLEFYRSQVAMSMFFNDNREGNISEYATSENVRQSSAAVHNKTALFVEQHRMIVEKALTGLVNCARHYYRDNPEEASIFLDDVSITNLLNTPASSYEWLGIEIKNGQDEIKKLDLVKSNILGFIQNGVSPESIMELMLADTIEEVRDIVYRESKQREMLMQQQQELQQQMTQQEIQAKLQEQQMKIQARMQEKQMDIESKERRTLWDREKFALQNDIDRDGVNDLLQRVFLEIDAEMKKKEMDNKIERDKMKLKEKLEMAKINKK